MEIKKYKEIKKKLLSPGAGNPVKFDNILGNYSLEDINKVIEVLVKDNILVQIQKPICPYCDKISNLVLDDTMTVINCQKCNRQFNLTYNTTFISYYIKGLFNKHELDIRREILKLATGTEINVNVLLARYKENQVFPTLAKLESQKIIVSKHKLICTNCNTINYYKNLQVARNKICKSCKCKIISLGLPTAYIRI